MTANSPEILSLRNHTTRSHAQFNASDVETTSRIMVGLGGGIALIVGLSPVGSVQGSSTILHTRPAHSRKPTI